MSRSSEAASAIIELINTKPTTPTVEEIAALIGKPAAQGGLVLTIGGIAQEIAELWRLRDAMEQGDWKQKRLAESGKLREEPVIRFDGLRKQADERRDLLKLLLLRQEPENIHEVLALLLIATDALDDFANEHTHVGVDDGDASADRDFDQIRTAIGAVVRWLVNRGGATSPILKSYFPPSCLVPRSEEVATALARERELPALAREEVQS